MKRVKLILLLSLIVTVGHSTINEWTGTGNWSESSNWSLGHVPNSSEDAQISSGTCTLNQNGDAQNFTITSGAALAFQNGKILSVYGDLTVNGSTTGDEKIRMRGSGNQNLNGSLSISEAISVESGAVLVTSGNLTLESGGSLVHGDNTPNGGGLVSGSVTIIREGNASSTFYNTWSSPIVSGKLNQLGTDVYQYDPTQATLLRCKVNLSLVAPLFFSNS